MTEQQITRSINIVVGSVEENSYGDMLFTDKEGNNYKIGNKRVQFFKDVIIEGNAVQLNYTTGYGKEYIYNAKPIGDMLPPPTTPQPVETRAGAPPREVKPEQTKDSRIARMNATTAASNMISGGMFPAGDFGLLASQIERWNNFELDASQIDANLKKMLKGG